MKNSVNINISKCKWKVLLLFVLCSSRLIGISCQLSTKFVNENSSLLFHPLINATQAPLLINSTGYDLLKIKKLPWHCLYSGEIEGAEEVRNLLGINLKINMSINLLLFVQFPFS